jgi:hypothetical protein
MTGRLTPPARVQRFLCSLPDLLVLYLPTELTDDRFKTDDIMYSAFNSWSKQEHRESAAVHPHDEYFLWLAAGSRPRMVLKTRAPLLAE